MNTIDYIVAEMRGNAEHNHALVEVSKYLTEIADRIEEAAKRELEAGAEAEQICVDRIKAALVASNDDLNLSRSNSMAMYQRLNAENIRNSEMYREMIHGLREENALLRAALKPVLDAYISQDDPSAEVYDSRLDADVCVRAVRDAKRIYNQGGAK